MAAPALIALAVEDGPRSTGERRAPGTVQTLVDEVRAQRPDLRIEAAALTGRAHLGAVVDRLVRAGHEEVVVVPLVLVETTPVRRRVAEAVAACTERHPDLRLRAADVLGLEPCFLEVLDERMREALSHSRVRELDALVLCAAGSDDPLANQSVARLARLWGSRHRLPVTAAFASSAPPAAGEAVRAFRGQGRRHIAVASLFLAPGELTERAAELALEAGAVAVSAPLGTHPEVARAVLARYAVGAVELVPV